MRRRSIVGHLPLVLVIFAMSCGIVATEAQDLNKLAVRFTRMHINDCPEIGACSWKLLCRLGNDPDTELIRIIDADTNGSIEVNGSLTAEGVPPVTVTCTVREFDSSIGFDSPVWELVGANTLTFPEGHQEMRIDQNRDEGDVTLKLLVERLASTSTPIEVQPPPPAPAAPTGCRADGPGRCGDLEVKCDVPLPAANEFLVSGMGHGIQPYYAVPDLGSVYSRYMGEGNFMASLCARNRGGTTCSNTFPVELGATYCAHPPPPPPRCPPGEMICRNVCKPPHLCQHEE